MTSSWLLSQRKKQKSVWNIDNFSNPGNTLGGWEDHYITPGHTHECHPDYTAIPIGNPYGFMVCKRKTEKKVCENCGFENDIPIKGTSVASSNQNRKCLSCQKILDVVSNENLHKLNGYHKFSADLYRPWQKEAIQITDPYSYYSRKTPNEQYLHANDYLSREIVYNSNGIDPIHTPGPRKYREYGFAFTPKIPPRKYDVQQLHQKYPYWEKEMLRNGDMTSGQIKNLSDNSQNVGAPNGKENIKNFSTIGTW